MISAQSNYCAMIGSHGMTSVLKKEGYEHIKTIGKSDFGMTIEYIKVPSKDVLNASKIFFLEVRDKGG